MAYYIVSYDLMKNKDYKLIIDELTNLGAHKALLSMWFVELSDDVDTVYAHFIRFLDSDDKLVVAIFDPKATRARAIKGTNDWLKANR